MTDTSTTTPAGPGQTQAAPVAPAAPPAAPVPTPPPAGAPAPQMAPGTTPPTVADPTAPQTDISAWPPEARAEVERLRREAGDARINAKNTAREEGLQTAVRALAQAAGIELPSDAPATLEAAQASLNTLAAERDATRGERDAAVRDRDLVLEAWKAKLDPSKVEYLRFLASGSEQFGKLDPKAADYGATLSSTVAALIAADQTLKVPGATTASGASEYGGADGTQAITQEQFNKMDVATRTDLYYSDRATYDRLAEGQYAK